MERKEEDMQEDIYQIYLSELESIETCSPDELEKLLKAASGQDKEAKRRLIEGHLKRVLLLAAEYAQRGLPMGDLIQEANMELAAFVGEYQGGEFLETLDQRIRLKLEEALEAQNQELKIEEEVAARVNVLQTVSQSMAEELGREATVEELAEKMKMTADEIRNIMKLALDALSVEGE